MASVITHPTRILKSRDVTVRIGAVPDVNRPSVNYTVGSDRTELYRIDNGRLAMYEFQGASTSNFQIDDTESTYRFVGDSGWADGVITNSRVQMSVTANYLKNLQWAGDPESPSYYVEKGRFDEAQAVISKFRNNKETEAWIEIWKFIDTIDGGLSVYDVACFAGVVMNYQEQFPGDGLVESSFDVMSRGEAYMGLYSAIAPIRTGLPNRLTFPALPAINGVGSPTRQVIATAEVATVATPLPTAGGLTGVDVDSTIIFKYTEGDGTTALGELVVAADLASKPRARLVKVSDSTFVPCVITSSAVAGTVTLTPAGDLEAATEYFAEIEVGAVSQTVDPVTLLEDAAGVERPLNGFRTGVFATA